MIVNVRMRAEEQIDRVTAVETDIVTWEAKENILPDHQICTEVFFE